MTFRLLEYTPAPTNTMLSCQNCAARIAECVKGANLKDNHCPLKLPDKSVLAKPSSEGKSAA